MRGSGSKTSSQGSAEALEKIISEASPEELRWLLEPRYVLVFRTKPRPAVYLRMRPKKPPTERQLYVRRLFTEATRATRGQRMKPSDPLPPAAMAVKRLLSGVKAPGEPARRAPKWLEDFLKHFGKH